MEDIAMLQRMPEVDVLTNSLRRADIQHAHTVGPYAMTLLMSGRVRVVTAHLTAGSLRGSLRGDRYWHSAFMKHLRRFYNSADAVVAVSRSVKSDLEDMGVAKPIHVVPNSIDVAAVRSLNSRRAESRERLGVKPDEFLVVGVGQVQPRKGIATFVECARAVPEATFCWVGGMIFGPLADRRTEMRHLISSAPRNCYFTGPLERSDVLRRLAAADLFFLPSLQENCPMAALEAAAVEIPLLLRNIPAYSELFGSDCKYGDEGTFVRQIEEFIDDRELLAEQSRKSSRMAAKFDSSLRSSRMLEVYRAAALTGLMRSQASRSSSWRAWSVRDR
ncbi:glycosyltransferase family 4 protein [Streptomyces prunicolor]|uniref:glycosyltransferase family 4 protein n=1 Tax=Streptomyces prunicolor TaxID=67348 RepID=UPI0037D8549F